MLWLGFGLGTWDIIKSQLQNHKLFFTTINAFKSSCNSIFRNSSVLQRSSLPIFCSFFHAFSTFNWFLLMKKWMTNDKQEFDEKTENVICFSVEILHEIYSIFYKSIIYKIVIFLKVEKITPLQRTTKAEIIILKLAQSMKQRDVIQLVNCIVKSHI